MELCDILRKNSKIIRVSLVGYGSSASYFHLPALKSIANVELFAAIDPSPQNRNEAIKEGFRNAWDIDNLQNLSSNNTDLVIICSPNIFHYEQVLLLLKKGINVVCEKPLCLNYKDVEILVDVAKSNQLILCPFHNRRFDDEFIKLKEIITKVGKITQIDLSVQKWDLSYQYASENFYPKWRKNKKFGGGMFNDWMPHLIDKLMCIVGFEIPDVINSISIASCWTTDCDDLTSIQYYWREKNLFSRVNISALDYSVNLINRTERVKILGYNGAICINGNDESGEINLFEKDKNPQVFSYSNNPIEIKTFYERIINAITTKKASLQPISFEETLLSYKLMDLTLKKTLTNYG